jgi:hypothetical protein
MLRQYRRSGGLSYGATYMGPIGIIMMRASSWTMRASSLPPRRHGDFGLGTFNGLDGEILVVDGVC